jgi:hypothetical protein
MNSGAKRTEGLPDGIDHLIYAAPDLETGISRIESLIGTRPAIGGRHPRYGTHNALVSLGPKTYLEIIAPDPDAPAPERGRLLGVSERQTPQLVTWVMRSDSIQQKVDLARAAGVQLGDVESGSRQAPDGTLLTWRLSDPYAMPLDGAVPFLIDWSNTPHPSESAPFAGTLNQLHIEHPDAEAVRSSLSTIDADMAVTHSEQFQLIASITTDNGLVILK